MKKNFYLIVLQIILCIICFLNNWFKDNILYSSSILTSIILNIVLAVLFLTCYYISFKGFKNFNPLKKICTLSLCIITIFLSFYNFRLVKTKLELKLYHDERDIIVEKIKNNEFSYYYKNNIKLPLYNYVSSDGEVYVYKNDTNGQVFCFWIYRGIMSSSVQLIYASKKSLIYDNVNSISEIIKLENHWYYVITE